MHLAMKARQIAVTFALLLAGGISPALAQAVHMVAPKGAQITCVGTPGGATCPWASVGSAIQSGAIKGGDTLLLMDGRHDPMDIRYRNFSPSIIIQSATARNAIVDTIFLAASSGFTFRELKIQSFLTNPYPLFRAEADTSNIVLENASLQSLADVSNVLSWTAAEWLTRRRHGVWIQGSNSRVLNCTVNTVASGIWSSGVNNQIIGNTITNVSSDGLRAGSATIVVQNEVTNFFRVDDDHIDGFQSVGDINNPVTGLRFRRNTIIEWAHPGSHPLRASTQGIGMFDGFYDDFSIRNNLVVVSAHHGIAVYGGRNGIISNNTVVHPPGEVNIYPWIGVFNHKNGTPSVNVIVANNLAMAFSGASAANNVVLMDNQVILNADSMFENTAAFDYRPKATSSFVDTGNPTYTPKVDIDGVSRTQGVGPDKGAHERRAATSASSKNKLSETTEKTLSTESVAAEEDIVPQLKAPKPGASSEDDGNEESDELIYDNQKPVRTRRFWTDGVSLLDR